MSITPKWSDSYSPAEASRGCWIPLDMSTESAYPSSGRGRYAQIVYMAGTQSTPASASTFVDTSVANTTYIASTTFIGGSATVLTPPADLKYLEIYNNSSENAYMLPLSTTYNDVSTRGIIIAQHTLYTISRTIPTITIALDVGKSADLRVIGHYIS
jgi:hypothetical protein